MTTTAEMTQEALDHLVTELTRYEREVLPALAEEVASSRTDSLSPMESHALTTAITELHQAESHANALRARIADARVVVADSSLVSVGSVVTLEEPDGYSYQVLVGSIYEASGNTETVTTSPNSPLGEALMGAAYGDQISWSTPSGHRLQATVTAL